MTTFPVRLSGDRPSATSKVAVGETSWAIATEVPAAFVFNRRNYAVLMVTPDDPVDLAVGFSLTERVITSIDEIKSMDVRFDERGIDLRINVTDEALIRLDTVLRRRNLVATASCGLCGLDNVDTLFRRLTKVSKTPVDVASGAIEAAARQLRDRQPLNEATRSVHAAAWISQTGKIDLVREDVGRHNALDKLLGALARARKDMQDGFVLMSSRCSYEIVEKAATCGVTALASISGPTTFALEKARQANLSVYNVSRDGAIKLT